MVPSASGNNDCRAVLELVADRIICNVVALEAVNEVIIIIHAVMAAARKGNFSVHSLRYCVKIAVIVGSKALSVIVEKIGKFFSLVRHFVLLFVFLFDLGSIIVPYM